jgi:hypothetical protein
MNAVGKLNRAGLKVDWEQAGSRRGATGKGSGDLADKEVDLAMVANRIDVSPIAMRRREELASR